MRVKRLSELLKMNDGTLKSFWTLSEFLKSSFKLKFIIEN
jgi:hypothetical protein